MKYWNVSNYNNEILFTSISIDNINDLKMAIFELELNNRLMSSKDKALSEPVELQVLIKATDE